jgi:acetoin utilization protein AcuC
LSGVALISSTEPPASRVPFFYHPRMLAYDFGPEHPLKPERLRRTIELLQRFGIESIDPGLGDPADALRVHSESYVDAVRRLSHMIVDHACEIERAEWDRIGYPQGFGSMDNPPFGGMYEASLAYLAGTVEAAKAVRDGAPLAINLSGGLHHALPDRASGFCIFDDPAVAMHILLEKYDRVAYVDIDLHHGDGVQWIWYEDPRVLTYSIHQDPRGFFPGTGYATETGETCTCVNAPLEAATTGDTWLWAFENTALPALEQFKPGAIVLQMGTDPHFLDPLGHLQVAAQDWLSAIMLVKGLGIPLVAVGGGGYNLTTVPRMWSAATLTLMDLPFEDKIPEDLALEWTMPYFFDPEPPVNGKRREAEGVVMWLEENVLPNVPG